MTRTTKLLKKTMTLPWPSMKYSRVEYVENCSKERVVYAIKSLRFFSVLYSLTALMKIEVVVH